ncbi:hypothetical protein [Neorhizobium sp. JUb45]|nr:hypothetical protein [Neorhizobium sp. JUb45]
MTTDTYQRLLGLQQAQVFGLYDAPEAPHRELMTGLDEILAESNTDI